MLNYAKAEFCASYGLKSQLPAPNGPEVVFSGRSNVGKSSLINKLCMRKSLARVSATPGKTATVNFYKVDAAWFVDLPGYGYAKTGRDERRRWVELINGYFEAQRPVALLVQLLDSRHAPSADDVQMMEYLHYHSIPFLAALTKADKLKAAQKQQAVQDFQQFCLPYGADGVILTSAQDGFGMEELRSRISLACETQR